MFRRLSPTGRPSLPSSGHRKSRRPIEPSLRKLVQERANATTIREKASSLGMQLLRDDGVGKVLAGRTTIDEVARVASRAVVE